ncbi:MAG: MBL fold metallo-hydrolase [Candidatus Aminicenantes bacterium]|nr:MBL fold metallo-hydrolase [Candidatus Aminicenantes bacterium]
MSLNKLSLGTFEVHGLRDGFFHLDGGAMFGVVPKVLWEKTFEADSLNRIKLGLNSILVDTGEKTILVDTGIGKNLRKKIYEYYSVEQEPGLKGALEQIGYASQDVDFVINTHLHFDHCGGNTTQNNEGEFIPAFPNARYIIQKGEWNNALDPGPRDKPSYDKNSFLPLDLHGQLNLVEGDTEVTPGVQVELAEGHTSSHQLVRVKSGAKTLYFMGDMIPTASHVHLPYVMSYDLYPVKTLKNKEKFLQKALQNQWILALNHDPQHYFGTISKTKKKYEFNPLSGSGSS